MKDPCAACGGDCTGQGGNCPAAWAKRNGWNPPGKPGAKGQRKERDRLAGSAMNGMLSGEGHDDSEPWYNTAMHRQLAITAYAIADAMLAERAKS